MPEAPEPPLWARPAADSERPWTGRALSGAELRRDGRRDGDAAALDVGAEPPDESVAGVGDEGQHVTRERGPRRRSAPGNVAGRAVVGASATPTPTAASWAAVAAWCVRMVAVRLALPGNGQGGPGGGPHCARCWANQSRAGTLAASKPFT